MIELIERFWAGVLHVSSQLVVPDWGALVALLPLGLLGVVALVAGWLGRTWVRALAVAPPGQVRRPMPMRMFVGGLLGLFLTGAALVAVALIAVPEPAPGEVPEVRLPILLAGLAIAILAVGSGIRLWEQHDPERDPDLVDAALAWARRHVRALGVLGGFALGAAIVAWALVTTPEPPPGQLPDVPVPILLAGLAIAIASVGRAISWWDAMPDPSESTALVPADAPAAAIEASPPPRIERASA